MKILRAIQQEIMSVLGSSEKIVIIYGPRQVGKTTLVKDIVKILDRKTLFINADEEKYNPVFASRDLQKIYDLVAGYEILVIDEAQRIENIGLALKILHDAHPEIRIIVTGSSSLDLATKIKEPLTGRTWTYHLYPLAFTELRSEYNRFELDSMLGQTLVYGSYPEVFFLAGQAKEKLLTELSSSYLYRDILEFEGIRYPRKIRDLLKLLAFQIGQEVSINELANALDINANTVIRYIDLLEKSFVIFRLSAFSRNLRKEVSKKDKIYFYDLGVRNSIIDNLKWLADRDDMWALWENFLIAERIKKMSYSSKPMSRYFWRVYTGDEIDYIEEFDGMLHAYEFKYKKRTAKPPKWFLETYPESEYLCINQENYLDFIL